MMKPLSRELMVQLDWDPNVVWYDAETNTAELILQPNGRGQLAVSPKALDYLVAAVNEGRLAGARANNGHSTICVLELRKRIGDVEPTPGDPGPFELQDEPGALTELPF